ncbi:MAG: hypothetical protein IPO28_12900 [Holophagaceae bacterium]|nr:hypothetical protein [Holophagaceae bacterium]
MGLHPLVAPLGWMDHPDPRKHHSAPTARTAGLALWLMLLALLALDKCPLPLDRVEWAGVHAMAILGLIDDRLNLRSRPKALIGLGIALVLAVDMAPDLGPFTNEVPFLGLERPIIRWSRCLCSRCGSGPSPRPST